MTGADLAAWRQAHGLSVDQAATLFRTSRQSIYAWEKDEMIMRGPVQQLLALLHDPIIFRRAIRLTFVLTGDAIHPP